MAGYCLETIFQAALDWRPQLFSEAWTQDGRGRESSQIVLTDDYICGERGRERERMTILAGAGWFKLQ